MLTIEDVTAARTRAELVEPYAAVLRARVLAPAAERGRLWRALEAVDRAIAARWSQAGLRWVRRLARNEAYGRRRP